MSSGAVWRQFPDSADFGRRGGGTSAGSGAFSSVTLRNFFRKVASSHEPTGSRPCRSARRELGLDTEAVPGLGGWRTSSEDTTTARVPYRQVESAPSELELDAEQAPGLGGWLPRTTLRSHQCRIFMILDGSGQVRPE